MVSAVPAGEVIARDDVLGMVSPAATTMETTSGVVRLPGRPPTECLSTINGRPHDRRSPTAIIARVSAPVSAVFSRSPAQAVMNADRSMSVYLRSAMSLMIACIAASSRR